MEYKMIRDSVIYIDIENVISVEENNQYYMPSATIEETKIEKQPKSSFFDFLNPKIPEAEEPKAQAQEPEAQAEEPEAQAEEPEAQAQAQEPEAQAQAQEPEAQAEEPEAQAQAQEPEAQAQEPEAQAEEPKYSIVYIRPTHCDSLEYINYIKESNFCDNDHLLYEGYENILKIKTQEYNLSLHYLNYHPKYISHLEEIMSNQIRLISFICDPLQRVIRHYNFSNSFKEIYTFDEYYLHFGNKYNVGWTGKIDVTNNYFASYLGFSSDQDITEEKIRERYALIFVGEKYKASFKKLNKLLKSDMKEDILEFNYRKFPVNPYVKDMFIKNNELDYKLYNICCQIMDLVPEVNNFL